MSALEGTWLPAFDPITGVLALPLWIVGALAALLVVTCMLAFTRTAAPGAVAVVVRYAVLLVVALVAWAVIDRSGARERTAERRALDARAIELTARAIAPGSALACLDASTGEAVERACEKALFAAPESVAAAVAYVNAKLTLLADGLEYANRVDGDYVAQLEGLRRAAETDRFGLVAHVLATRDGCTAEICATFKLLNDPSRISINLKENALEGYLTRHAANWSKEGSVATASRPHPVPPSASGPTTTRPPNAPSAISIPAVSIMTAEPLTPPLSTLPTAPAAEPPRRPPQAAAPPKKPAPSPPPRIQQPAQGATPALPPATAGGVPPPFGGQPRVQ